VSWSALLGQCVLAGQPEPAFDDVTLRRFAVVCEAAGRRDARAAWMSAQYGAFAFHSPNEMPGDPGAPPRVKGGRADRDYVRAFFKTLARKPHGG
jgi:hypothetical protein